MCFILRLAPCFVATARAVLLSALASIRNDSPISCSIACSKSTQLTVHQEHTFLILHWTRQQSPVLHIHSSRENDQRNTECKMCLPCHWVISPVSIRISRDVCQGLVPVIWFQCRCGEVKIQFTMFLSNISTPSCQVSNKQVLVT